MTKNNLFFFVFFLLAVALFLTSCTTTKNDPVTLVPSKNVEKSKEPLVGESCGTVTPGFNDACCERKLDNLDAYWDENTAKCAILTELEEGLEDFKDDLFEDIPTSEPFCGTSTFDDCNSNSECVTGGCSGQICKSKGEEAVITTCEYRLCYNADLYDLNCECIQSQCQWG